jgi:predicted DNA-binding transcriptional regulator YafY
MRASRLLSILMMLQARERVTALALAEECEVSVRTIYRDIDALSAAGVPVYSDRGSSGGYRLLDGYRTRLNGLSEMEAGALLLSGGSGATAALGLGEVAAAAQLKVAAALPKAVREVAETMQGRFYLDAPGWFHEAEEPEHLRAIAAAVWAQQKIEMRYRSWKAEKHRCLEPLGLVMKAGAWYLVGAIDESVRTYRVSRINELKVLAQGFERPQGFDLEAYWRQSARLLEESLHRNVAKIRLSATGYSMLEPLTSPFARAGMCVSEPDAKGYRVVTLPVGSLWPTSSDILRFGVDAEVLEPAELRDRMTEIISALRQTYSGEAGGLENEQPACTSADQLTEGAIGQA